MSNIKTQTCVYFKVEEKNLLAFLISYSVSEWIYFFMRCDAYKTASELFAELFTALTVVK